MKVIELLNKIANGEEVPKKIRIDHWHYKFEWKEEVNQYWDDASELSLDEALSFNEEELNYGIHVIEEPKKIDKLDITLETTANGNLHNYLMSDGNKYAVSVPYKILNDKLDEIINYINKGDNNE